MWVEFARSMMPMMMPAAHAIAERLASKESIKVLDIAAGHGAFGIAVAHRSPKAEIVALDWKLVLDLARENAKAAGVQDRIGPLPTTHSPSIMGPATISFW